MRFAPQTAAPQVFDVVVSDQGTTRIVGPRGQIDLATAGDVRAPLVEAIADGFETVVVDFTETTFIDSSGIHVMMEADASARRSGVRLVVLPGPAAVERAFEVAGLHALSGARPPLGHAV